MSLNGAVTSRREPFGDREQGADKHFWLCFYGALLLLREIAPESPLPAAYEQTLAEAGATGENPGAERRAWNDRLARWEQEADEPPPLVRIRALTGLDRLGTELLVLCGLTDEDRRLGRPSLGLVRNCWDDPQERATARQALARLIGAGLVHVGVDDLLHADPQLWELLTGAMPAGHVPAGDLPDLDRLVLPDELRNRAAAAVDWLCAGRGPLIARGPRGSGRRTLLGALARAAGLGLLDVGAAMAPSTGVVAGLLGAVPLVSPEPAGARSVPAGTSEVPAGTSASPPAAVAHQSGRAALRVPPRTAVEGAGAVLRLDLTVPDAADRALHWGDALRALGRRHGQAELETLAQTHRMTGGLIRRIAPGALAEAGAAGRVTVTPADVTRAARAVRAEIPVSLATRLDAAGSWDHVVVPPPTLQELRMLERRCRRREQLSAMLPATLAGGVGPGVRALFTGPSGTGKTLAARLLAGVLGKDLYRVDLAGVVDKYLGETEKNLDRVLDHAEALDVVLLIDEGDALLAKRTEVHSSNDRYANLETNYLLQRLDTFEGIVVITTNAQQHLDSAFARRLDVVIEFPAPGPAERQRLWRAHLPSDHQVDAVLLGEAAARCALTGGQVRNAVLHASLLALDDGGPVGGRQLAAAIRREYAKQGALCPLRDRSDEPRDRHQRHDRHDTPAGGGD
jgi:hypothetical protein